MEGRWRWRGRKKMRDKFCQKTIPLEEVSKSSLQEEIFVNNVTICYPRKKRRRTETNVSMLV
ncbi:hypothetical protein [Oryza sativa Japonica Group]|uniref:Uncharacterized protein n=1 Tax=Oryza sativa subsp. japonica TaxID=39947 RepID=Q5QLT7_ORYSJ|nr:hypothetical protein [Oryza sativa Japonica Group]BAD81846.1 hypothetical protein [Oryza sativa Japonica Group]